MRGLPAVALHHQHPMKTTVSLPAEGSGMRALYALASKHAARTLWKSVWPCTVANSGSRIPPRAEEMCHTAGLQSRETSAIL